MTPPARIQAAIELLDQIITAARDNGAAADTLIQRYFATRRYAGSKDRRAVRELVYAGIRAHGEPPPSGRAALAGLSLGCAASPTAPDWLSPDLFDGSPHGPAPLSAGEGVPPAPLAGWAMGKVATALGDENALASLLARAPLDLRVNTLVADPAELARELGAKPISGLYAGLRLPSGADVSALAGRAEVQDAGSQIVTLAARAQPGQRIVDLCAGGGGKTLALAAAMGNEGAILATDTDRSRLSRLCPRAERAGVAIVETRLLDPGRELDALAGVQADTVLIDAPCSGTGTWRRNPEARWRLSPDRLARLVATQARLLDIGASLVRPGGALVYIVCSLLEEEGADQAAAFATRTGFTPEPLDLPAGRPHGPGQRLDPAHDGTDGFFVARLMAPC